MAITPAKLLEEWKKKLLDLSKRNRLLNFRPTKRGTLQIVFPDFEKLFNDVLDEKSLHFAKPNDEKGFAAYIANPSGKHTFEIRSNKEDLSDEIATLRALRRKAKTITEEQGINVLHLAFGFIHWKESENSSDEYSSPLILVPVSLNIENVISPYELSLNDDDVTVNPTLCYKLEHDYNLNLPEYDSEEGLETFFRKCEKIIRGQKGWSIEKTVQLSIFSYLKINMYNDLEDNADVVKANSIVKALGGNLNSLANNDSTISEVEGLNLDKDQKPDSVFQVLDADSSQQEAIELAKKGASFVLQGPPGTGKSQTITNIIAECLAAGKKILFVSEKEAALDVVRHRLEQTKLMDFCLSLHSHKANKKDVINELYRAATLDKKRVKEEYLLQLDKLYENRLRLDKISEELHQEIPPLNKTIYEINGELATLENTRDCVFDYKGVEDIAFSKYDSTVVAISGLQKAIEAFDGNRFSPLWNDCALPLLSNQNRNDFQAKINEDFFEEFSEFASIPKSLIGDDFSFSWTDSSALINFLKFCSRSSIIPDSWRTSDLQRKRECAEAFKKEAEDISTDRQIVENNFEEGIRNFNSSEALDSIQKLSDLLTGSTNLEIGRKESDEFNAQVERILQYSEQLLEYIHDITSIDNAYKDIELNLSSINADQLNNASALLHQISKPLPINDSWFKIGVLPQIERAVHSIEDAIDKCKESSALLDERFEKGIYCIDIDHILPRFRTEYNSIFRVFKSSYKSDMKVLRGITPTGKLSYKEALHYLNLLKQYKEKEAWFKDSAQQYQAYFTGTAVDMTFDTAKYSEAIATFSSISAYYNGKIPTGLRNLIVHRKNEEDSFQYMVRSFDMLIHNEWWSRSISQFSKNDTNLTISGLKSRAEKIDSLCKAISSFQSSYNQLAKKPQPNWTLLPAVCHWNSYLVNLDTNKQILESSFGCFYEKENTDWQIVLDAIDWLIEFKKFESTLSLNNEFCENIISDDDFIASCSSAAVRFESLKNSIEPNLKWFDGWFPESNSLTLCDADYAKDIIAFYQENLGHLDEWLTLKRATNACNDLALESFINVVVNNPAIRPDEYVNIFKKRFFAQWLDTFVPITDEWSHLSKVELETLREDFQKQDKSQMLLAQLRIYQILSEQLPSTSITASANDQLGVLRREFNKKRRQLPLRKLFNQIPALVLRVKPCLMMSPLSVSLLLQNKDYQFDVIIFDEASQIKPENAIGSIIRGKQIIIAGDTHQLPPTSFFEKGVNDEDLYDGEGDDDEDFALEESILDAGANILPEKYLKWHYRSRHEHLIAFSNSKIYNGRLTTFPSVIDKMADNGVEFVYVKNAVYDRGGKQNNEIEAQKVADLVFEHIKTHPDRSLGIIANSESQARAIEDKIIKQRTIHPEYENFFSEEVQEPFFVKSLESVQGDERDSIIFSVGYGKDSTGKMYQSFGPLNKDGGERRLNVAVTRAKYNLKLVSSITAEDIVISEATKQGPRLLKLYIDFARRGIDAISGEIQDGNALQFDSPFEESVYNFLTEKGYQVETQVGCAGYRIDLGVKDPDMPGRYIIGIECDGATYHSSKYARERDRLRQEVLENIGWNFYRIWSTEWIRHTVEEKRRLLEAIEKAIHNTTVFKQSKPEVPEEEKIKGMVETVVEDFNDDLFANEYDFRDYQYTDDGVYDYSSTEGRLKYIIEKESPIHKEYLYKRFAPHMGREKATTVVRSEVDYVLVNRISKLIAVKGEFIYWKPKQDEYVMRVKSDRDITYISPEELQFALLQVAKKAIGITKEGLIEDTAHAIGYVHTGSKIQNAISDALSALLKTKKLSLSPSGNIVCNI